MTKLSNKGLLGIALVLSLATSLLVYNYLKGAAVAPAKDTVPVIVARADIPPTVRITPDMVEEVRVPAQYLQPGAIRDAKLAVGIVAKEKILRGEQVTERRLLMDGKPATLSAMIPSDRRAVTVAVSEVIGVANFVRPGDRVDVLVTFDQNVAGENVANVVLQDILVLATNHETKTPVEDKTGKEKKDAVKSTTATLAVTPQEAAYLVLGEEKGKIRLALRPFMPDNGYVITKPATPRETVGLPPQGEIKSSPVRPDAQDQPGLPKQVPMGGIQMIRGTKIESVPVS